MAKDIVNGRIGILMWVMGLMVTIQVFTNGWTVRQIITFNTRIAKIEASRFDSQDGLEIWREIALIRAEMK